MNLEFLEIYLTHVQDSENVDIKIKYLDTQYKKYENEKLGLSYAEKHYSKLTIISRFLESIASHKQINGAEESKSMGFFEVLKKLLQLAHNNLDMLEGIGGKLIDLFQSKKINNQTQEMVVDHLWNLKHLCPKDIIIYAINNLKKYSTKKSVEEALKLHSKSVEIWKSAMRIYKENKLFTEQPKLLNKGMKELGKESNRLLEYYNEEINN